MAQTTIRANTVPEGGAIQPNGRGMGGQSRKLGVIQSKALFEAFTEASEYNEVNQGTVPLMQGQQQSIQLRNVGFLQKTILNFKFEFEINQSNAGNSIFLAEDFPYCLIPRITSQLNGATVLHSGTSAELQAIYDKKYSGEYSYVRSFTADSFETPEYLLEFYYREALEKLGVNTSKHTMYTTSGTMGVLGSKSGTKNVLNIVSLTADQNVTRVVVEFSVPIEYTIARDNLVGILPLQNNSIYHEIRIDVANALAGRTSQPFIQSAGDEGDLEVTMLSASVQPINCFWSVPLPNDPRLYQYFISFNYINQSQSTQTTGAGANGFNFNMKNNSYLMSSLFTFRDSDTRMLIPAMDACEKIFMDYNGTAQVLNIPMVNEFRTLRERFHGKLPVKFGEYLKDFANTDRNTNGDVWAKYVDLYQANSPRFVGDTLAPNMTVSIMQEYLAPVDTQQIM